MRSMKLTIALALATAVFAHPAAAQQARAPRGGSLETANGSESAADTAATARRAMAMLARWQPAAARPLLESAGAAGSEAADLRAAWGLLRAEENAGDEALAALTAAERLDANAPAPAFYRGEVLLQQDKLADAQSAWRAAAERAGRQLKAIPDDAHAQYLLGAARVRLKEFARAREALAKARTAGFDPALVSYQIGLSYAFAGTWKDAERELSAAIAAAPDLAHAYYYRGAANSKLGNKAQAFKDYERFLELAPTAPEAGRVRSLLASLH